MFGEIMQTEPPGPVFEEQKDLIIRPEHIPNTSLVPVRSRVDVCADGFDTGIWIFDFVKQIDGQIDIANSFLFRLQITPE